MDEKRLTRVCDIVDTFSEPTVNRQLESLARRHPDIREEKYLAFVKDWHPNLLTDGLTVFNNTLKVAVLARLCYNLKLESAGMYSGDVRHSELIVDTSRDELGHYFNWKPNGGTQPEQSYDRTLGSLITLITNAETHRTGPRDIFEGLNRLGFDFGGSMDRQLFTGELDVNGTDTPVRVSYTQNGDMKLRYILSYSRKS